MKAVFMVVVDEWGHQYFSWPDARRRIMRDGKDSYVCVISAGAKLHAELSPIPVSEAPDSFRFDRPSSATAGTSQELATQYFEIQLAMAADLRVIVLAVTDPDLSASLFAGFSSERNVSVEQLNTKRRPAVAPAAATASTTATARTTASSARTAVPPPVRPKPPTVTPKPPTVTPKPRVSAPAPSPARAAKPAPAAPKVVGPPPAPRQPVDWGPVFRNGGRRALAGLLTYVAVVLATAAGYVVVGGLSSTPEMVPRYASATSVLTTACALLTWVLAAAVALLGGRWRRMPYVAVALAAVAGIPPIVDFLHPYLPSLPLLPGTERLAPALLTWAGPDAGWVCLLGFVPATLVLASRATRLLRGLPGKQTGSAGSVRRTTAIDRNLTGIIVVGLVLVIPAWGLGHLLVALGIGFHQDPAVFDTAARDTASYRLPLTLGGSAVLACIWAVAALVQGWRGRARYVSAAVVVLLTTWFVVVPWAGAQWTRAEAQTGTRLLLTDYPYAADHVTCGGLSETLVDKRGDKSPWQVYVGVSPDGPSGGCNKVEIYKGWKKVGSLNLRKGQVIPQGEFRSSIIDYNNAPKTAEALFWLHIGRTKQVEIKIATYDH